MTYLEQIKTEIVSLMNKGRETKKGMSKGYYMSMQEVNEKLDYKQIESCNRAWLEAF